MNIKSLLLASALLFVAGCGEEDEGDIISNCTYNADILLSNTCFEYVNITEEENDEVAGLCSDTSGTYTEARCSDVFHKYNRCETKDDNKRIISFSDILGADSCEGTFTAGTIEPKTGSCSFESLTQCTEYQGPEAALGTLKDVCESAGVWADLSCTSTYTSLSKCVEASGSLTTTSYGTEQADCTGTFTAAQ